MNWTMENILLFISFIPFFIAFLLLNREFRRHHERSLFFMMLAWLFYGLYSLVEGISYLILSPPLFVSRCIFMVLAAFCVCFSMDLMNQDRLDPLKIALFSGIGAFTLYASTLPSSVELYEFIDGGKSFSTAGPLFIGLLLLTTFLALIYLYYIAKIYHFSPNNLKQKAKMNLYGAICVGPFSVILYISRISLFIPGIIPIVSGIGALITAYVFSRSPQLAYVLPTTVYKLAIVSQETSYLIYIHRWVNRSDIKRDLEDMIFTGLLHGIVQLFRTTLKEENIEEIKMKNAVLLLYHLPSLPYMIVLLASRSTRSLRNQFLAFASLYSEKKNMEQWETISIIQKTFPYIPTYETIDIPMTPVLNEAPFNAKDSSNILRESGSVSDISSLCISCHNIKIATNVWTSLTDYYQSARGHNLAWEICPTCRGDKISLLLGYFDPIIGPKLLTYYPETIPSDLADKILNLMDIEVQGFFLHTLGSYNVANFSFKLNLPTARGGFIQFLLSYSKIGTSLDVEFAKSFLKEVVQELQSIPDLAKNLLENETEKDITLELLKNMIQKNFHLIYERKISHYMNTQMPKQ